MIKKQIRTYDNTQDPRKGNKAQTKLANNKRTGLHSPHCTNIKAQTGHLYCFEAPAALLPVCCCAMAGASFTDLIAFLEREEESLKAVAKSDLKSTLRTGAGTKGNTADSERFHFYKIYCQLAKTLTEDQRNEIARWEDKLCTKQEDAEFRKFFNILETRKDELQKLAKSSLEACFNTQHSRSDKDLTFCWNFLKRKKASFSPEQEQQLLSLEREICAEDAALRPVPEVDFRKFVEIVQKRKDELQKLSKSSLEACFNTQHSKSNKDLTFCANFLKRQKASFSSEQKQQLLSLEREICAEDAALRPVPDVDFRKFVEIVQKRKDELQKLSKSSLEACFNTQHSKSNKDLTFCANFLKRQKASFSPEQEQQLLSLEREICAEDAALRPVPDVDFRKFVEIVQKRQDELQKLSKSSLEACFNTQHSKSNKDLTFCANFLKRQKASFSPEQEQQLLSLEREICAEDAALRPVPDVDFRKFVEIVQKRKDELQELSKSSLEACFNTQHSKSNKDLTFCANFLKRQKASFSPEQKQQLLSLEREICHEDVDFRKFVEIVQKRKDELQKLSKSSLEACFNTQHSKSNKDLTFCANFLKRQKASFSLEQEQQLLSLERDVCVVHLDDFRRFTTTLQTRGQELAQTRPPDLHAIFSSRRKKDQDLEFCRLFWQRNASKLTSLQQQEVDELAVTITCSVRHHDRAALRPAVGRLLCKFEEILDRRRAEFVAVAACSTQSLFARHVKKTDNELRFCYDFLARVFPTLNAEQQQHVRSKLQNVLVDTCQVPLKAPYQGKLHAAETILSDALPRPRLPKSLRQFYGNSMDAEARVMTFFNRVHEVDTYMTSLEFQDCDYCHEGWFGTTKKKAQLPGGFESEVFKKTNFLRAP